MKNSRFMALIITAIIGGTATVVNYLDSDIVLDGGEVIERNEAPKHVTKAFKKRDFTKIKNITYHHTAGPKTQTVESIAQDQINRGFAEFAYHFAIYHDGTIAVVNDITETTWHDSGENTNSIGIVFVGNYQEYMPSQEALDSALMLQNSLCSVIPSINRVRGHRDTSATLCPGDYLYNQLETKNYFGSW